MDDLYNLYAKFSSIQVARDAIPALAEQKTTTRIDAIQSWISTFNSIQDVYVRLLKWTDEDNVIRKDFQQLVERIARDGDVCSVFEASILKDIELAYRNFEESFAPFYHIYQEMELPIPELLFTVFSIPINISKGLLKDRIAKAEQVGHAQAYEVVCVFMKSLYAALLQSVRVKRAFQSIAKLLPMWSSTWYSLESFEKLQFAGMEAFIALLTKLLMLPETSGMGTNEREVWQDSWNNVRDMASQVPNGLLRILPTFTGAIVNFLTQVQSRCAFSANKYTQFEDAQFNMVLDISQKKSRHIFQFTQYVAWFVVHG
jgi:hypothetical protein